MCLCTSHRLWRTLPLAQPLSTRSTGLPSATMTAMGIGAATMWGITMWATTTLVRHAVLAVPVRMNVLTYHILGRCGKGKTGTLLAGDDNVGSYNNGSYNNGTGNLASDLDTLAVCCMLLK